MRIQSIEFNDTCMKMKIRESVGFILFLLSGGYLEKKSRVFVCNWCLQRVFLYVTTAVDLSLRVAVVLGRITYCRIHYAGVNG